jgi:putative hydrolase of the HAD superfamily
MTTIDLIAFDADDTLWHTETLYIQVQENLKQVLSSYIDPAIVDEALFQTEMRNLPDYGYGIKSFTLSQIETAIDLTEGRITGSDIKKILDQAKSMINAEVQLLDFTRETVTALADAYPLMIVTKGDLLDQEAKIERSGLKPCFRYIEIVSDKTCTGYTSLLAKYQIDPAHFLMVGNSLRSDILPVIEMGGQAVFIPYHLTWEHENVAIPPDCQGRFHELEHIGLLPELIAKLNGQS